MMKSVLKYLMLILFVAHFSQEGATKQEDALPLPTDDIPVLPIPSPEDDIPMPPIPSPEDDIPMPPIPSPEDDILMPPIPSPEDDIPMPPIPSPEDEAPLPSPSEVKGPTLAQDIPLVDPEMDIGTPRAATDRGSATAASQLTPLESVAQLSKEQDAHERVRLKSIEQKIKKDAAQNEFQAKAIQRAQRRQLEQRLARQEVVEGQERERFLQQQTNSPVKPHASSEKLALEQERMNPQAAQGAEPSKGIAKEHANSASLTDEHGNFIHQDELKDVKNEKPHSVLGSEDNKP